MPTPEAIAHAIDILESEGRPVSVRKVRKLIGGGSLTDVLRLMHNQQDTPIDPRLEQVVDMAGTLEVAIARGHGQPLAGLIAQAEQIWPACIAGMLAASARGEPTEKWAEAFEQLRLAVAAAKHMKKSSGRQRIF